MSNVGSIHFPNRYQKKIRSRSYKRKIIACIDHGVLGENLHMTAFYVAIVKWVASCVINARGDMSRITAVQDAGRKQAVARLRCSYIRERRWGSMQGGGGVRVRHMRQINYSRAVLSEIVMNSEFKMMAESSWCRQETQSSWLRILLFSSSNSATPKNI